MRQIAWDNIAPLVRSARTDGTTAYVTFACPASAFNVDTAAPLEDLDAPTPPKRWLSRLLAKVLGREPAATRAGNATLSHDAIIAAFCDVAGHFAWDEAARRYVAAAMLAETQTALQGLLRSATFETSDERLILARVLADVAAADAHLDSAERAFFETVFGRVPGQSLEDMLALGAPTAAELETLRPELRLPLLALGAAMSMSDEIQDPGETARLRATAEALGVSADDQRQALVAAREHILDEAIMAALIDRVITDAERAALTGVAQRLGASIEEFMAIEGRCRRRLGLATP